VVNYFERRTLLHIESALLAELPGIATVVRSSDYTSAERAPIVALEAAGERSVLSVRLGENSSIDVVPEAVGWFVVSFETEEQGSTPIEERSFEPLGLAITVLPGEVARALVPVIRRHVSGIPASKVDPALAEALRQHRLREETGAPPIPTPFVQPGSQPAVPVAPFRQAADESDVSAGGYSSVASLPPLEARPRWSAGKRTLVISSIVAGGLVVVGGLGVILSALILPSSTSSSTSGGPGTTSITDLQIGDCFDVASAVDASGKVRPLSCDVKHDSELFAVETIPPGAKSSRVAYDQADIACYDKFAPYVGTSYENSSVDYDVLSPSDSQWSAGDRTAYCYIYDTSRGRGSVKGTGN
jgi:hypothetical protein